MISFSWFIGGPLIYFAVAFFLFKTAATFMKYAKLPRHLRWDLYPVPHQGPEGSKYQKVDFGEMKPHISLYHELKEMSQEMLFIKKALINNPKVWAGSFPLHAGIYLGLVWLILLFAGSLFELGGVSITGTSASLLVRIISYVTIAAGAGSFISGLFGSLVLLYLRVSDDDMRLMSDVVSFVNLGLMIALFGSALAAWIFSDLSFSAIRLHLAGLLTFSIVPVSSPLMVLQLLAFCAFLIYLPFSRMMHFVGKYFFYHNIMWDDEMMKRGSAMENDIATYLNYKTTWSAPHIRKDGTWVDQVADDTSKDGEKK
jgi:nitrate reductase gamma subunit